jgi:DNA-binding NtrC family response regulator/tetratricopeptide (TPR) repeat protein
MTVRSAVAQLFQDGEYGRIYEDTRRLEPRTTEPLNAAMIAQATFEAGNAVRAREWAMHCVESASASVRARGQLVLALCTRAKGNVEQALQLHQAALRSAEEAGDEELEAWTAIHLLRHLLASGRSIAAALVPMTRAKSLRVGSTHVTAYLHSTVAVGEGHAGRPGEARRHLQIASHLVRAKPHPWLHCAILGTQAAMALAERELREAADCLELLRTTARRHGLNADYVRSNVNYGNWALFTGKYDVAEAALREVMDSPETSLIAKLTAEETLAELRLAQGRTLDCERILNNLHRKATDASLTNIFAVRWGGLVNAQSLLKRGDALSAVQQLAEVESTLHDFNDQALAAATKVTMAQALAMTGDATGAASHLAAGAMLDPAALPHVQGQLYEAAAAAVSEWNHQLAYVLSSRARYLRTSQGATSPNHHLPERPQIDSPNRLSNHGSIGTVVAESAATLLGLGGNPKLLADELQRLIKQLGCSPEVALVKAPDRDSTSRGKLELLLPQRDSSPLTLVCAAPSSPDHAIALGSIMRIGQSAIELERLREAERQRSALWPDPSIETSAGAIFESEAMRDVLTVARRISDTAVPVLITGETGTGKEVLARLIHTYSGRSKAAFSPFNCTSTSRDMIESQLFGHRRGAFTGATDHSQGVIRAANHGTLLLDEVGDMPLEVQPKLLRFLESGEIHPLGESRPMQVDVRVIAATNVDLKSLVSSGAFREDLYYRMSIVPLHLPPLRERRSEIPSLATHYLTKFGREFGKGELRLSEDAMEHLLLFRWPGNVRQLANEMRRVAALSDVGAIVMPTHLNTDITGVTPGRKAEGARREVRHNEALIDVDQPLATVVEQIERAMIGRAMERANGVVEIAAKILGISRKGLYLKRLKYQMVHAAEGVQYATDTGD